MLVKSSPGQIIHGSTLFSHDAHSGMYKQSDITQIQTGCGCEVFVTFTCPLIIDLKVLGFVL